MGTLRRTNVRQIVNVTVLVGTVYTITLFVRSGHSNWNLRFPLVYPLLALLD